MGGVKYLLGRSLPKTICYSEKRSDEEFALLRLRKSRFLTAFGMTRVTTDQLFSPPARFQEISSPMVELVLELDTGCL